MDLKKKESVKNASKIALILQEFSGQVKNINSEKIKPPRPDKKQDPKEPNSRQKMLEYSKNVPKPVLRKPEYDE